MCISLHSDQINDPFVLVTLFAIEVHVLIAAFCKKVLRKSLRILAGNVSFLRRKPPFSRVPSFFAGRHFAFCCRFLLHWHLLPPGPESPREPAKRLISLGSAGLFPLAFRPNAGP